MHRLFADRSRRLHSGGQKGNSGMDQYLNSTRLSDSMSRGGNGCYCCYRRRKTTETTSVAEPATDVGLDHVVPGEWLATSKATTKQDNLGLLFQGRNSLRHSSCCDCRATLAGPDRSWWLHTERMWKSSILLKVIAKHPGKTCASVPSSAVRWAHSLAQTGEPMVSYLHP